MKKFALLAMVLSTLFVSCTSSIEYGTNGLAVTKKTKATEMNVYSGGNELSLTRANTLFNKTKEEGYSIPKDGKFDVWYYIRIDGNIPGEPEHNFPANQYFPQTSTGKTMIDDMNHGYIYANVNWHESSVKKFPKYIWSTDGSAVQSLIASEPTLEDLLACNQSGSKYDLSGYIDHKDELHFIWYTCKQQSSDHSWHIDGILTSKDRTDISQTIYGEAQIKNYDDANMVKDYGDVKSKANVEIDVHQQEHTDWNEIKTSIHMRDTVDIEVFLPIGYEEMADDFDIRVGKDFEYITEVMDSKIQIGDEVYDFEVTVTHEQNGIRINVAPNKAALKAARELYADGITFELHSYVTSGISKEAIWDKLKNTTYKVSPFTDVTGQITSAYNDERIDF